jgi:hypothetical protein
MKTKVLLSVLLLSAAVLCNAQLKVKSNGKAIVGSELIGQDPNNALTMQILGKVLNGGESKVAFGDYGCPPWSCNVLVGEYGAGDTDRLCYTAKWEHL